MSKEDDYRRYAAETVDLASRANTSADKSRLLARHGEGAKQYDLGSSHRWPQWNNSLGTAADR
jgi:hypothetical protein